MPTRIILIAVAAVTTTVVVQADEVLYRYEGNVVPYDASAEWLIFDPCEPPCSESIENGHFVLRFDDGGNSANYSHLIASSTDVPPPTLWVEWRFRSNRPIGPNFFACDGQLSITYRNTQETVNMYGNAAISRSGDDAIFGLDIDEVHTYRFESLDGQDYRVSVDGEVFIDVRFDNDTFGAHYLQLRGQGGCTAFPNAINEWDFVRYGTISFGEQIIASDPPAGMLNSAQHGSLDRFTVTFDAANYVYIDEVTVNVTGGIAPTVIHTRRRENDEPDTVEIVLDRPIPLNQTTTFTFNDGTATNVVEYTLQRIDTDGDGLFDDTDNCPNHPNSAQADCDNDGEGDVCAMADCAGVPACGDCNGNLLPDGCEPDTDGDGLIDLCDPCPQEFVNDEDGDGVCFPADQCPTDAGKLVPGLCGCGMSDVDSDLDTVPDCQDRCPGQDDLRDANDNGNPDCLEPDIVPTASTWGLAILAVALLCLARRLFRRHRHNAA